MNRRGFLHSVMWGSGLCLFRLRDAFAAETMPAARLRGKILFDSKGVQVQVQRWSGGKRLNTLFGLLDNSGYAYSLSDSRLDLTPQLLTTLPDVLVILTHQRFPANTANLDTPGFRFSKTDLQGIPAWVAAGGGLLLISNHGGFMQDNQIEPPYWPNHDEVLAEQFGITIVPAAFAYGNNPNNTGPVCTSAVPSLVMRPAPTAPKVLVQSVGTVQAWDSCGIAAPNAEVVCSLPAGCSDQSGLGYSPADYCFCLAMSYGQGKIIVAGHSGIVGDPCTIVPVTGQICSGSNLRFLYNAFKYLSGA